MSHHTTKSSAAKSSTGPPVVAVAPPSGAAAAHPLSGTLDSSCQWPLLCPTPDCNEHLRAHPHPAAPVLFAACGHSHCGLCAAVVLCEPLPLCPTCGVAVGPGQVFPNIGLGVYGESILCTTAGPVPVDESASPEGHDPASSRMCFLCRADEGTNEAATFLCSDGSCVDKPLCCDHSRFHAKKTGHKPLCLEGCAATGSGGGDTFPLHYQTECVLHALPISHYCMQHTELLCSNCVATVHLPCGITHVKTLQAAADFYSPIVSAAAESFAATAANMQRAISTNDVAKTTMAARTHASTARYSEEVDAVIAALHEHKSRVVAASNRQCSEYVKASEDQAAVMCVSSSQLHAVANMATGAILSRSPVHIVQVHATVQSVSVLVKQHHPVVEPELKQLCAMNVVLAELKKIAGSTGASAQRGHSASKNYASQSVSESEPFKQQPRAEPRPNAKDVEDSDAAEAGKCAQQPLTCTATGRHVRTLETVAGTASSMAVSGDEKWLVVGQFDGNLSVYSLPSGELVRTFGGSGSGPLQFDCLSCLCFAPNGHLLAVDSDNFRLQELTLYSEFVRNLGDSAWKHSTEEGHPWSVAIWHSTVAVGFALGSAPRVVLLDFETGQVRSRFGSVGTSPGQLSLFCNGIRFTADGRHLVVAEREARRLSLFTAGGKFVRCLPRLQGSANDVAVLASGVLAVIDYASAYVRLYTLASPVPKKQGKVKSRILGSSGSDTGSEDSQFTEPIALAAVGKNLYVLELRSERAHVHVFE